jgi:5-(carboxyamino)imidazole ribonucleotide mutase
MPDVTIIAGSNSDAPVLDKCKSIFEKFGIAYDVHIASAHRDPQGVEKVVSDSDAKVFIAVAGLSAALPGVIASKTTKPVIGVPVNVKLDGLDALLSIMQMPPGIPVATVGIDRGENAALLAVQILSLTNDSLISKMEEYRKSRR